VNDENSKQKKQAAAEPGAPRALRPVSERKARANRENAKKSTGPKTARGKRYSSFNAIKHGLLAKKVLFAPDGKLANEDLQRLMEGLRDGYGCGDMASELLAELAAVDYWRLAKGLEYELKYLTKQGGEFHPQGGMPTLVRYMTANRRNFDKSLQLLMQRQAQNKPDVEAAEGDFSAPDSTSTAVTEEELSARRSKVEAPRPVKETLTKIKEGKAA
jgi:hypothetical protein